MTPKWMTKLRARVAALKMDANLILDQRPLTAAAICAAAGGMMGLMIGVVVG